MTARLRAALGVALLLAAQVAATPSAWAVGQCGNQKDTCKCGKNNPYPCCDNGSNCTWWAWNEACCNWGIGLPGWGNANTWASYAKQNSNFVVQGSPVVGSIATSTKGTYGHVAWVIGVGNGTVTVREMNCCGTCAYGMIQRTHATSYFNSGFIVPKPKGPVCGNGGCEGGEHCANCPQDCGGCCGNGACDHGETCGSCSKDCTCPPKGALDVAACSSARGWASDDNVPGKALTVRLKVDGKELGNITANAPHGAQGNHGFSWTTPTSLHDDTHHTVVAVADDGEGKGNAQVGSRPLRCWAGERADGPWTTQAEAASSVAVQVRGAGSDADAKTPLASRLVGLDHRHPKDDPYATSGAVQSCLQPGTAPFERAFVEVQADASELPLTATLRVDGSNALAVPLATAGQTLTLAKVGLALCLRTAATAENVLAKAGGIALRSLRFQTGSWWHGVEATGHGLRLTLHEQDGGALEAAPALGLAGANGASGAVRVWRPLAEPFDSVRGAAVAQDARASLWLLTHAEDDGGVLLAGQFEAARLSPRTTLALRLTRPPGSDGAGALTAGTLLEVKRLRVGRNDSDRVGFFDVDRIGSFGLQAMTAEAAAEQNLGGGFGDPAGDGPDHGADAAGGAANPGVGEANAPTKVKALGRVLVLSHRDAGWWSTGTLRATLRDGGPAFDRARLRIRGGLTDSALTLRALATKPGAQAADAPVLAVVLDASGNATYELALQGDRLALELAWSGERWKAPSGAVRLEGVAVCRDGWWSLPSESAVGIDEARSDDGALRLHAHNDDGPAKGLRVLQRELDVPQTAVRFRLRQDVPVAALRIAVLLDGVPAAVLEEAGPSERTVEVHGLSAAAGSGKASGPQPFSTIGLLMQRKDAPLPVGDWTADFDAFELRGVDGVWRPLAKVPLRLADALAPVPLAAAVSPGQDAGGLGADAGGLDRDAGATAPSAPAAGCSATPARSSAPITGGWLIVALALAAVLALRRAEPGEGRTATAGPSGTCRS